MGDLYKRLKDAGFDRTFVVRRVLPDWWEDSLASVPANRALAEATIARFLRLGIAQLRDRGTSLKLPSIANVRLKHQHGVKPSQLAPSILLGEQVAAFTADSLVAVPRFGGLTSAGEVRSEILGTHGLVNLRSLLDYSWRRGIGVVHLAERPKAFDGMALFCDDRPMIVLASGRDGPPWLAFHLAHELGHVLLGHVASGDPPLLDSDLDHIDDDEQETHADEFACELLSGRRTLEFDAVYGRTAEKLVAYALDLGNRQQVDPGALALFYGRTAKRIPVAQKSLAIMDADHGAHHLVAQALESHLPLEEVPESTARFLSLVTAT